MESTENPNHDIKKLKAKLEECTAKLEAAEKDCSTAWANLQRFFQHWEAEERAICQELGRALGYETDRTTTDEVNIGGHTAATIVAEAVEHIRDLHTAARRAANPDEELPSSSKPAERKRISNLLHAKLRGAQRYGLNLTDEELNAWAEKIVAHAPDAVTIQPDPEFPNRDRIACYINNKWIPAVFDHATRSIITWLPEHALDQWRAELENLVPTPPPASSEPEAKFEPYVISKPAPGTVVGNLRTGGRQRAAKLGPPRPRKASPKPSEGDRSRLRALQDDEIPAEWHSLKTYGAVKTERENLTQKFVSLTVELSELRKNDPRSEKRTQLVEDQLRLQRKIGFLNGVMQNARVRADAYTLAIGDNPDARHMLGVALAAISELRRQFKLHVPDEIHQIINQLMSFYRDSELLIPSDFGSESKMPED